MKLSLKLYAFFIICLATQVVHTSEKWIPLSLFAQNSWIKTHSWKLPSFENVNSHDAAIYTTIAVASAATLYGIYRWMQPVKQSRITPLQAKKPPMINTQIKPAILYPKFNPNLKTSSTQLIQPLCTSRGNQTESLQQNSVTLEKQNNDLMNENKRLHGIMTHFTSKLIEQNKIIAMQQDIIEMQSITIKNSEQSADRIYSSLQKQK